MTGEIVVEQRGGRWCVYLREGTLWTKLGGFAHRSQADEYAGRIAGAAGSIVDGEAERVRAGWVARAGRAASTARDARAERDALIRAALDAGATVRQVAAASGLSPAGVAKIGKRTT